eukprot:TRINITY_DN10791_c0_g2_i1.p1 TRINITY_DN10791_c0_g2~~TRINITY_DN10791_c0_g2_i1.p1  ORF type:complete len:472 (+),score=167.44 TRINITY_DN10791_c0_g2_i1:143-1558(+)
MDGLIKQVSEKDAENHLLKERISELQLGLRTSIPTPPKLDLNALPSPYKRLSQIPAGPVLNLGALPPPARQEEVNGTNQAVVQKLDNVQEENQSLRAQVNYYKVQNEILKSNTERMDNLIKELSSKETEIHLLRNEVENARLNAKKEGSSLQGGDLATLRSQLDAAVEKLNTLNYLKVQNDLLKANTEKMDKLLIDVAAKETEIHILQQRLEEARLNQQKDSETARASISANRDQQAQVTAITEENEILKRAIEKLREEIRVLEAENANLKQSNSAGAQLNLGQLPPPNQQAGATLDLGALPPPQGQQGGATLNLSALPPPQGQQSGATLNLAELPPPQGQQGSGLNLGALPPPPGQSQLPSTSDLEAQIQRLREEVAASKALVEEYIRRIEAKDAEIARLKTSSENLSQEMGYLREENAILLSQHTHLGELTNDLNKQINQHKRRENEYKRIAESLGFGTEFQRMTTKRG